MQFMFGLPSDFYASAYGEATLLLDAAYSGEVLPGSHLDVFVNEEIAATAPIATSGGEILRHLPIRIPMTHFKPGANLIRFEAQLDTAADQLCPPGGAANLSDRFAIFDTSEFIMPDFARIARLPDLAALVGSGFPYGRSTIPTALAVNEADSDAVSAAAMLLARIAIAGGRIIPFDIAAPTAIGERNAIFVAPADQAPSEVLAQLGIDQSLRTTWRASNDLDVETDPRGARNSCAGRTRYASNVQPMAKRALRRRRMARRCKRPAGLAPAHVSFFRREPALFADRRCRVRGAGRQHDRARPEPESERRWGMDAIDGADAEIAAARRGSLNCAEAMV
jgi:hypothetical protein